MIVKVLEIRDRATYIPAAAMKMDWRSGHDVLASGPIEIIVGRGLSLLAGLVARRSLYASVGFWGDAPGVILMHLSSQRAHSDPHHWGDTRTMTTAHTWIIEHFDELDDGQVVDVEHILGEKPEPSKPQRQESET